AIAGSDDVERLVDRMLDFPGRLMSAAPAEFLAAMKAAIAEEDAYHQEQRRRRKYYLPSSQLDGPVVLGKQGIGGF
ncbi:MAG: hypothetical protein HRT81_17740, partial [Henriciella sp.]|nr:hypothetical protein [Henriciella sp.]